jgi:hypothetical protein
MNPNIEVLKKEDGPYKYKIRRVSDSKIVLKYKIPILASNGEEVRVIDIITVKIRYKMDLNEIRHSNELPLYHLIPFKDRFLQILSQNWKIKKKYIHLQKNMKTQIIEGHMINGLYTGFIFDDKSWTRDYMINKILENETGSN